MRATILTKAIILTNARRAAVSMMAKGSSVTGVLPLRCFLFLLPNYTNISVFIFLFAPFSDEPEVFLPKYSLTAILHAAHLREGSKALYLYIFFIRFMDCIHNKGRSAL